MKNIIQSFSYPLTDAALMSIAEEKAQGQGISFSKYLLRLIKEDLQKQSEVSILAERQTTITEYDIKLFEPSQERLKKINSLTREQQTSLAMDVLQLQNQIRSIRR